MLEIAIYYAIGFPIVSAVIIIIALAFERISNHGHDTEEHDIKKCQNNKK